MLALPIILWVLGRTAVWNNQGKLLAQLDDTNEGFIIYDMNDDNSLIVEQGGRHFMDKKESEQTKKMVAQSYDTAVSAYAQLEGEEIWPRMRWLQKVLNRLEQNSHLLDLGCGSGDPAAIEIAKQHQITGVDISQQQIKLAQQNVPEGTFIHSDLGSIEFPNDTFDAIVCFYTLEHIPRQEHQTILNQINQWLKPSGYLLFSIEAGDYDDHHGEWLGVPMFISTYPPEILQEIVVEAGFEIVETAVENQIENETTIPYLWLLAQKAT